MNVARSLRPIVTIGIACLFAALAHAQESKTVIGPSNPELSAGADALLAGDAEEGVRLTLAGLEYETSARDQVVGMSNLCAGYIMLEQYREALEYCNRALDRNGRHWRAYSNRALLFLRTGRYEEAEKDLVRAEKLAPRARTVRTVRSLLRDKVDPVAPSIIIDDRRQTPETETESDD